MSPSDDNRAADAYFGNAAAEYDQRRELSAKWRAEDAILAQIISGLPRKCKVLDVPVGTGRLFRHYSVQDIQAMGADVSEDMLRQASFAGFEEKHLQVADIASLPFDNAQFNYAICVRLLNWLSMPLAKKAINELARVSRDGVILHVRTSDRFSMDHVVPAAKAICKAPVKELTRLSRSIIGRRGGLEFHEIRELEAAILSTGLRIAKKHVVDEGTAFSRELMRHTPLNIYELRFQLGK